MNGVKELLAAYEQYLRSYSGGAKDAIPAEQEVRRVERLFEDLFGDDAYSPVLLRRLKDIGAAPGGLLWRYQNGQCRAGKPLKATTIGVYVNTIINLTKFLYVFPANLNGVIRQEEILEWQNVAENCSKTFHGKRSQQDLDRKRDLIGTCCTPKVFERFINSSFVADTLRLLEDCSETASLRNERTFMQVRDILMLVVSLVNARRTGDIVNMTLLQFTKAMPSTSNAADRIVFVSKHKVKSTKLCCVNFYDGLYGLAKKYVDVFGGLYLIHAGVGGCMFPHVSHTACRKPEHMS